MDPCLDILLASQKTRRSLSFAWCRGDSADIPLRKSTPSLQKSLQTRPRLPMPSFIAHIRTHETQGHFIRRHQLGTLTFRLQRATGTLGRDSRQGNVLRDGQKRDTVRNVHKHKVMSAMYDGRVVPIETFFFLYAFISPTILLLLLFMGGAWITNSTHQVRLITETRRVVWKSTYGGP